MKIKASYILACGTLCAALANSHGQATFTKITSGPVVHDGGDGQGSAWVDFDGDGDLDLYVGGGRTPPNLLYRNDGKGDFTPFTTTSITQAGLGSAAAAWADLDNDGRIDLFVTRQDGVGLLFHQENDGSFTRTSLATGAIAFGAAWGDYDHDGFIDLLVGDTTKNILWHNNGQGGFVPVTGTPIITAGYRPNVTWMDYINDGRPDVFATTGGTTGSGTGRLYRNDGNGLFTPI